MPRLFPLFLLLAQLGCAAQQEPSTPQTSERYPFQPLGAPDTLTNAAAVRELQRRSDVLHAEDLSYTEAEAPNDFERNLVLLKKWNDGWLAYPIAQGSQREGHRALGPQFEKRCFAFYIWTSNIIRGHETQQSDLVLVDPVNATYAAITTYAYEYFWEPVDGTEEVTSTMSKDSTAVTFTSQSVILVNQCWENGLQVPCAESNAVYRFTPEALVIDSTIHVEPTVMQPATYPPLLPKDRFPFHTKDRLCPQYFADRSGLLPLSAEDRTRLLQDEAQRYRHSELFLFAELEHTVRPVITILCSNNDDHDLLWLRYDETGKLTGLDTLVSQYGDGQESTRECAYYDRDGVLVIEAIHEETLRDGNDTMAYLCDTLLYERRVQSTILSIDENGNEETQYELTRRPMDLTRRWVECHAVNDREPYAWHSVKALLPPDRRVLQAASGDLDRDGATDHVFVLTDAADDGDRDLLIAFTKPDRCGFVQQSYLKDFLPARGSGGFHDPIGEEGISGISIRHDSLVIDQFGGSAWKWHSRSTYVFNSTRRAFYLVEQRGRSYHAPTVHTMPEELEQLEATRAQWDTERKERYAELKKMEAAAEWKVVRYAIGERPMAPKK